MSYACTVMCEVGTLNILQGASITVVGWHVMNEVGDLNVFDGADITVIGCHGCGLARAQFSWSQHYCV